jgi:hypothetical protein
VLTPVLSIANGTLSSFASERAQLILSESQMRLFLTLDQIWSHAHLRSIAIAEIAHWMDADGSFWSHFVVSKRPREMSRRPHANI